MRGFALPQTRVPGATRRVDPDTLMLTRSPPFWNMPEPVSYVEHTNWRRHKRTGKRVGEPVMVPVYRGTSASYARWVRSQIKRNRRRYFEVQAAEKKALQEADKAVESIVRNPGGNNVEF